MFVEVKVCIPESRVSILSPYFTAEFVLLEFGVLWLVSAAAEWDLQADEEEFRSPGRAASWPPPLMTAATMLNSSNRHKYSGMNILNAK